MTRSPRCAGGRAFPKLPVRLPERLPGLHPQHELADLAADGGDRLAEMAIRFQSTFYLICRILGMVKEVSAVSWGEGIQSVGCGAQQTCARKDCRR